MSGAEAFVAIGIASNFVQLLDFTTSLAGRIQEYSSGVGTPKKITTQADRLSDLLRVLNAIEQSSGPSPLDKKVLSRCQAQAQELSELLEALKGDGGEPIQECEEGLQISQQVRSDRRISSCSGKFGEHTKPPASS